MVLWLRRDLVTIPPDLLTIEKAMVYSRVATSVTEARRLIADGSACLNNEKIIPPETGRDWHKNWAGLITGNSGILRDTCTTEERE